jgi:hypothetical protein
MLVGADPPEDPGVARLRENLSLKGYVVVAGHVSVAVAEAAAQAVRTRVKQALKCMGVRPGLHFEGLQ